MQERQRTWLSSALWLGALLLSAVCEQTQGDPTKFVSGSSGTLWSGDRTRTYSCSQDAVSWPEPASFPECEVWAVVTTIFAPTGAVDDICGRPHVCCVIVADKKTPSNYTVTAGPSSRAILLSTEEQERLFPAFSKLLPWNHFGRKNVGYLYAVMHGAKKVWDFDDDNTLVGPLWARYTAAASVSGRKVTCESNALNVYGAFEHNVAGELWPRGFPLHQIKLDQNCSGQPVELSMGRVGVIQSLADWDPDVDAIYRLTRPLPIIFANHTPPIVVPTSSYSPYNAQATLHLPSAFWGMLLPITVHGRVTDIWRGYIAQRLMRLLDLHLVYTPAMVRQVRNPHSYMRDFNSELDLYTRVDALLKFLDAWQPPAGASFGSALVDLYAGLYEREYIEVADVALIKVWVSAMEHFKALPSSFPELPALITTPASCVSAQVQHRMGMKGLTVAVNHAHTKAACARLCCRHPGCSAWVLSHTTCKLKGPDAVHEGPIPNDFTWSATVVRAP